MVQGLGLASKFQVCTPRVVLVGFDPVKGI